MPFDDDCNIMYVNGEYKGVKMASKIVEEYSDIRAAEALQQGIQQGLQQKAIEDAKNFLAMKILTAEQVAQGTGLPLDKVLELQKTI